MPYRLIIPAIFIATSCFIAACVASGTPSNDEAVATATLGGTPPASGTRIPTNAPALNLTPRADAPRDITTAKALEAAGKVEDAAEAYLATAMSNTAARGQATLGAARMLLELEQPEDVRLLLEPFAASSTGADRTSHYLLARAYAALSRWQDSLTQYDLYIQSGLPAVAHAYLDRANVLLQLDQPLQAVASAQAGLNAGVADSLQRSYVLLIAQSYERASSLSDALVWYQRLLDSSSLDGDQALALARMASIKRDQQDPAAAALLTRLLAGYPGSQQAVDELEAANTRGEAIDPTVEGLVYYRQNEYSDARPFFEEQIADAPDARASATAYYYLAAIQESRDEIDDALSSYSSAVAADPAASVADDALWWQARILEARDETDEAEALLQRIVSDYPQSSWAPEASFRLGMLDYGDKNYEDAALTWARALGTVLIGSTDHQRLTFWQAKALLAAKKDNDAKPLLQKLADGADDDYYGIRAAGLLDGQHELFSATRESKIDLTAKFDWTAAESWLSQKTGRAVAETGWPQDPRWLRAQELWTIGRNTQADAEAFALIQANTSDPIALYTLSRRLLGLGRVSMSARAGQQLLRNLNTSPTGGLPKALLSLSYPAAFAAEVDKHAKDEDISPLLMLAFVRQESFFDPRAISPANAFGLTQLLLGTAQPVAKHFGVDSVDEEQLLEADTSLRYGAYHMSQQLKDLDNEVFVALAAYNAGSGPAKRWRKESGKDADVFLETIEFSESRLYVELVSENYAIYRYLYGGQDKPNLPK